LTAIGLLAWHFLARASWRWTPGILCSMWLECLALAAALVAIAEVQGAVVQSITGQSRPVLGLQLPADECESPPPATFPQTTLVHAPRYGTNLFDAVGHEAGIDPATPATSPGTAAASSLLVAYLG